MLLQVVTKLTRTTSALIFLVVVSGVNSEHGALVPQTVATAIKYLRPLKNTERDSVGVHMILDVMSDIIRMILI